MTPVKTPLNPAEKSALADCEAIIEAGLAVSFRTWNALRRIHDERLYRATHKTFADYCREKWKISRSHANNLIAASRVVENVCPGIHGRSISEKTVRALVPLPPAKQREVWREITESTPAEEITEKVVSERVTAAKKDMGWEVVERRPNYLEQFKKLWMECSKQEKAAILKWARQNQ